MSCPLARAPWRAIPLAFAVAAALCTGAAQAQGLAPAATANEAASAALEREFEQAQGHFRRGEFAGAYGRFMSLADRGHGEAALMAWAMHRWSQELFGTDWDATAPQRCAWALRLREAVRP